MHHTLCCLNVVLRINVNTAAQHRQAAALQATASAEHLR
jgi:hypothetical protein